MINIYKVVRFFYDKHKDKWTNERDQGFKECLLLFLTGIEKHPSFNAHVDNLELRLRLNKLLIRIDNLERTNKTITNIKDSLQIQIESLKEKLSKKQGNINISKNSKLH